MNLFLRFRIRKQDKIAANVAQHIRAVRAAEALDRRTHFRRTDSFNFPGLPSTIIPVQRSTSSEDSPAGHDKKRLISMMKKAYTEEVIEEVPRAEDVACQTSYDLLEALLPSLRKRVLRSEAALEDEDQMRYSSGMDGACHYKRHDRHHSMYDTSHGSTNMAYDAPSFASWSSSRSKCRNLHWAEDFESESKFAAQSELMDYDVEEVISLKEMKRSKALQLLGKKTQYNKLQGVHIDPTTLCLPHEGLSEASVSLTVSQDSLIEATSSIIEESASTGSDETSGSAVYKNIIINLGASEKSVRGGPLSASLSSTASAANLNVLSSSVTNQRTYRSHENIDGDGWKSSELTRWNSPNGNPKRPAF